MWKTEYVGLPADTQVTGQETKVPTPGSITTFYLVLHVCNTVFVTYLMADWLKLVNGWLLVNASLSPFLNLLT